MTKDEAFKAIKNVREAYHTAEAEQSIREILDQIDPPPQELRVRELCELNKASQKWNSVRLFGIGGWQVLDLRGSVIASGTTIDELKAKLTELATPPKPKTVNMDVPIEWAKTWSHWDYATNTLDKLARDNAKAALAKLEQQP